MNLGVFKIEGFPVISIQNEDVMEWVGIYHENNQYKIINQYHQNQDDVINKEISRSINDIKSLNELKILMRLYVIFRSKTTVASLDDIQKITPRIGVDLTNGLFYINGTIVDLVPNEIKEMKDAKFNFIYYRTTRGSIGNNINPISFVSTYKIGWECEQIKRVAHIDLISQELTFKDDR
jgi:hypothetical protein